MTSEEEFQRYAVLMENYKEQLQMLDSQYQMVQSTIMDHTKAKITLENLEKEEKNVDLLLPIGGGAFIDAKATKPSHILLDVGANIVIEKTTKDAIVKIDERIQSLQKNLEQVTTLMTQLQNEAEAVGMKMEEMLASNRQATG